MQKTTSAALFLSLAVVIDIHLMLLGGFGLLMSFLHRYAFSAMGLTMMITALATEWAVLFAGFARMGTRSSGGEDEGVHIRIGMEECEHSSICTLSFDIYE